MRTLAMQIFDETGIPVKRTFLPLRCSRLDCEKGERADVTCGGDAVH